MGEDPDPEEPEGGPAEHGAFEHFDLVDVSFDLPGAPFEGESGGDGGEVLAQEAGEGPDWRRGVLLGLANPFRQEASAAGEEVMGSARACVNGQVSIPPAS